MIEETDITDEIDAELWQRIEFWKREANEASPETPETIAENNKFIRRTIARYEADELRRLKLAKSPERIAENKRLFDLFAASDDDEPAQIEADEADL